MMNLTRLWSPMSNLTREQRNLSDYVTNTSALGLAVVIAIVGNMPAHANRMTAPSFNLPGKPQPVPERPLTPETVPQPPPMVQPPVAQPAPPPPVYNPPPPQPQPQPQPQYQPQPQPQTTYGTFRAWGELPPGRVSVYVDNTFDHGQVLGYEVYVQDNGPNMNDQMVILGPAGEEEVWIDCHNREEWKSYGSNSSEFVHAVVSSYCDWNW